MPVPTTSQELLDLVRKSELIAPQRLEEFVRQLNTSSPPALARDLAEELVAAGLVTQFQAEQFLQGKWRGFTIGKYKVLERLGAGGMGTVYLCEHVMVGRKVAVKVLPSSQASNPSALGRFYREARAAGVLDHPNLVKAHDVDEDGGLHYLVMDYVDGSSLQEIVSRSGPLPVPRACHYLSGAARGLQAAHQAGLVHRDVKPGNILVERNGTVRVLDLGLARFFNDENDLLTLKFDERSVLGTADYVSPEQALNSHEVDIRTDIYSLGATFYFCLTGQPPFPTGKIAQKLIWHQVRQPTPVRDLRPEVPSEVAAVVEKMMAKEPDRRFQTPEEVVAALARWTREPIAPPRDEEMPRLSLAATAPAPGSGSTTPPPSRQLPVPAANRARSAPALPAVAVGRGSSRPSALERTPCASDLATPLALPRTAPTKADPPPPAVCPSQLLAEAAAAQQRQGGAARSTLLFLLLALAGGVAGMALTWWLAR